MFRTILSMVFGAAFFVACSSDATTPTDGGASPGTDASTPGADASPGSDASTPGTDASPGLDASTPGTDAGVAPTFTNVYTTVIQGACTGCHSAGHSTGLDMSSKAVAYTNLVGKPSGAGGTSSSCQGKTRVVASDANASLFWSKIDHSAGCGNPMPLAGSKLAPAKIKLVEAWIVAGAKDD